MEGWEDEEEGVGEKREGKRSGERGKVVDTKVAYVLVNAGGDVTKESD